MKLSVSLPEEDVALLDEVAAETGDRGRSAVLQRAVALLRASRLRAEYEVAAQEWEESGEARAWAPTERDGLTDAPW